MKTPNALLILTAAIATSSSYAERIPPAEAPPVVQNAIRLRAGSRPIDSVTRNLQNGQVTYDILWRDSSGSRQEVVVSEAGSILRDVVGPSLGLAGQNLTLANSVGVAVQDLPPTVQNAIHNQLPDAPIDSVQRGIWNGQNIYEVTYHNNGRLNTIQITESGQPVVSQVPATATPNSTVIDPAAAQVATTTTTNGLGATTPTAVTPPAVTSPTAGWQPRYSGLTSANVPLGSPVTMAFNAAPRPVQETVNQLANGARIEDFERGLWSDRVVYQAAFRRDGRLVELQVADDGSILSSIPFAPDPFMAQANVGAAVVGAGAPLPPPVATGPAAPVPPGTTQGDLPGAGPGVPNTAAASTQLRYAGLAESNVPIYAGSRMSLAEAPREVQHTVQQVARGARIEEFQRGWWNGQVVYEAAFRRDGQSIDLQVLDDGSILTREPTATGAPAIGVTGTGRP